MPAPALRLAAEALAKRAPASASVLVGGVEPAASERELAALGLRPVRAPPAQAAFAPQASAEGPLVPFFEGLAAGLPAGALVVASDLMWRTAPTPELLAAFPGTRPMEGYEMQAEHAGFRIVEKLDAPRAAFDEAPFSPAQRAALAGDARGAALWRVLVLVRETD